MAQAPGGYAEAGAERLLAGMGALASVHHVNAQVPAAADPVTTSAAVNQALRAWVGQAVAAARLPLVPAGSCDAATGCRRPGRGPLRCGPG